MNREQRLLEIVRVQTEIAAARLEPAAVMAAVATCAQAMTAAEAAALLLVDGAELVHAQAAGAAAALAGTRVAREGGLAGLVVSQGRTLRCDDAGHDPRADREACLRLGAVSMVCAPLFHARRTVGVLTVWSPRADAFGADDEETLTLLSGVVAAHLGDAADHAKSARSPLEDALTGLGNRAAFDQRLEHELARRGREGGALALILADVDGLAAINHQHGRDAGDGVLRMVAAVFRRWTRSIDGVFRIGDDEFAMVLPGAGAGTAELLAERLAQQLADAHPLHVTVSVGACEADGGNAGSLIAAASAALAAGRAGAEAVRRAA
jgi:diguanylate cyclase (GGDEF)-like protein